MFCLMMHLSICTGVTKADREERSMVEAVQEQMKALKGQNAALAVKNKELSELLEKKKKELLTARRPTLSSKRPLSAPVLSNPGVDIIPGPSRPPPAIKEEPVDANYIEIAKKLKAR